MSIEKTGAFCEQFLKVYNGIDSDLTKHISDVLNRYDDDGNFDADTAAEAAKLWWFINCFANVISDDEVFGNDELIKERAEIISGYCDIGQEYIVKAFKELGAMAKRTEDSSVDLVNEALKFVFTIYNILCPNQPIAPSAEYFDEDLTSRIITDLQIAFSEGNICKHAMNEGVL